MKTLISLSNRKSNENGKEKKPINPAVMKWAEEEAAMARNVVEENPLACALVACVIAFQAGNSRFIPTDKKALENAFYYARIGKSNDDPMKPCGASEDELDQLRSQAVEMVLFGLLDDDDDDNGESEQVQEQKAEVKAESPATSATSAPDILTNFTPEQLQSLALAMSNSLKAAK